MKHQMIWAVVATFGLMAAHVPGAEPVAAPPASLTLTGAIAMALEANPELRAAGARVSGAAARADQSRRWTNPELELAAEDVPARSGSFRDSKNLVGLSQTIPWPGKKKLDAQIGRAGLRKSEAELELRRLHLAREVRTAFYTVLASERLVGVERDLLAVVKSSAETAAKRVEAGAAADQEQLRAEIQLDQARAELTGLEGELAAARLELATLLGRLDLKDAPLSGTLAEMPGAELLSTKPEQRLDAHPSMQAARMALNRAELELRRTRLDPYPDPRVGVDGGREGREDNAIVQFRVSLPLPLFDRSKDRQREAQANVREAEADLAAIRQQLQREWDTAFQRFRTAVDQTTAYRERILPKANSALKLIQTGFEEGKFGLIDLLDTQRTAAEARLAYERKLLEMHAAQAALESWPDASKNHTH